MEHDLLLDILFAIGVFYFILFPLFVYNEWNTYKLIFPDKMQVSFFEIVSQSNEELNWLGNSIFIFFKTGILFYILLLYIIHLIFCITIKWPIQFLFMKRKKNDK